MQTKAQCKVHREIQLKLFASRVQTAKVSGEAELVMVVEPCCRCIAEAKKTAILFSYEEMKRQAVSFLDRKAKE